MSEPQQQSKAQLRAQRRALQEAQRAAKQSSQKTQKERKPKVPSDVTADQKVVPGKTFSFATLCPVQNITDKVTQSRDGFRGNNSLIEAVTYAHPQTKSHVPSRKQEAHRVHLFKHLREADRREDVIGTLGLGRHSPIHPCFLALGVNFDEGRVWGANDCCLRFLAACEILIRNHEPPKDNSTTTVDQSLYARNFGPILQKHVEFLDKCRPLGVTIQNTYQFIKQTLNQLDSVENWEECRTQLLSIIDEYRRTAIYLAREAIVERASESIRPGECICTFGYSSVVARILERAWKGLETHTAQSADEVLDLAGRLTLQDSNSFENPERDAIRFSHGNEFQSEIACPKVRVPFSVLVIDSRPRFDGRKMLAYLTKAGIPCEYTHIAALPMLAHKVSLAIFGADALLNNGYVLAHIGTAQVANLISAISHAPTLVCAETYKFWERAHSDAFEYNELGDPDDIWRGPRGLMGDPNVGLPGCGPVWCAPAEPDLRDWRANAKLRLLNLVYDVLPPELVTAVVTEKGILPTTSVPVVLRVKQASSVAL
ncbi:Translation initiation factor eIF-2B subunit delta [Fasciola gigantica]|uniref:Translation initiation factor eIF2B subunit delta n=1 Tax=Fasciola gigantica TaxID=46835 RepID=A0A504YS86_FASGI|nr:Translation initiation factor eIF-2B subunit delta [Fasciola gigantica]